MAQSTLIISLCLLFFYSLFCVFCSPSPPNKPVWPSQFSSIFALYDLQQQSPIFNASSMFYYNWDEFQSQLIDYPTNCISIIPNNGYLNPCKLYFTSDSVYFAQPALGVNCCKLFSGVGTVPPHFLQGFNYTTTANAPDYNGRIHTCNLWSGQGFEYWTDSITGFDVFFRDGPGSTFWAWDNFNVTHQDKSIFNLPSSSCETSCLGGVAKKIDLEPLYKHPLFRLAANN
jgi:hypothetical protein